MEAVWVSSGADGAVRSEDLGLGSSGTPGRKGFGPEGRKPLGNFAVEVPCWAGVWNGFDEGTGQCGLGTRSDH